MIWLSTNDYVKFVTQQIVSYMDKPKEVRKESRMNHKSERMPLVNRWFGVIPSSIMLLLKRKRG